MSLLRDIQTDLASADSNCLTVLRKCKILAARLNSSELSCWVDFELDGYPETQPIPEYRRLPSRCYANFQNLRWRANEQFVPPEAIAKEYRDIYFSPVEFRQSITKALAYASSDGARIETPHLPGLIERHKVMYPELNCTKAWKEFPKEEFQLLIDAVKNRILNFSLKIEAENPSAGEAVANSQPIATDRLKPLVYNIFYGHVGNFAQNSDHFNQTARNFLEPEDLRRLVSDLTEHLDDLRLDDREKQRANAQIAALRAELGGDPDPVAVTQAVRTLRNITEGAIGSLIASAAQPSVWLWIHQMMQHLSK